MAGRNFERNKIGLQELDFSALAVHDQIVLETASGSLYKLDVNSAKDDKIVASLERQSDRSFVEGDGVVEWEHVEPHSLFDLKGSCAQLTLINDGPLPTDTTEGRLLVGQRAWLTTKVNDHDSTLVTSVIQSIYVVPAGAA